MHSPIKVRTKLVGDRRTSRLEIAGLQPLHHPGAIPYLSLHYPSARFMILDRGWIVSKKTMSDTKNQNALRSQSIRVSKHNTKLELVLSKRVKTSVIATSELESSAFQHQGVSDLRIISHLLRSSWTNASLYNVRSGLYSHQPRFWCTVMDLVK
jgi:hypothetical protein